jgi:acyl carrier protein
MKAARRVTPMSENLNKLKSAFVENVGATEQSDWNSLAYGSTPGWDSVAHMALVAAIEEKFDIMLSTDQVIGMSDFTKAQEIVRSHGIDL